MATRCNVKITAENESPLYLYRHWDGYLGVTGADIAEAAKRAEFGGRLAAANYLLGQIAEAETLRPARPHYELTDAAHGDIEYFYHIDCADEVTIAFAKGYGVELENQTTKVAQFALVKAINRERQDMNARIRRMNLRDGTDYECYEMIAE